MKKRLNCFFLIILTIILSLTVVSVKSNQTIDFRLYYHANVKKGDSRHYRFTYINSSNENYIETSYRQPNGTTVFANITTDQDITVIVTDANTTTIPMILNYHAYLSNTAPDDKLNGFIPATFINVAFDNNSIFQQYIDWYNQTNPIPLIYNQNYIYYNYTLNDVVRGIKINSITAYNWHTGWLEYFDFKSKDVHGNEITGIHLERVQNNILYNLTNFVSTGLYLVITVAILAIPILVLLNYKKYKKENPESSKNVNFTTFIQNNVKKTNKKKSLDNKPKKSVDHALEMIEDIISETNNQ